MKCEYDQCGVRTPTMKLENCQEDCPEDCVDIKDMEYWSKEKGGYKLIDKLAIHCTESMFYSVIQLYFCINLFKI